MREFEIVVYGATGFTGRLVAEYLAGAAGAGLRWAIAGRSRDKLRQIAREIGAPDDLPLIVADAGEPASLGAMAARAQVVLSTVGPYQLHGGPLVQACVAAGTGYVDLCGEPGWMRAMIDAHSSRARETGARLVFSCGFDSVPFDCGVQRLQALCQERWGHPAGLVRARVRAVRGGMSGGTLASLKATEYAIGSEPAARRLLDDPFALAPGFAGPEQPDMSRPRYDAMVDSWIVPFIMATINSKNVHRTNYLTGHAYGADFRYEEMALVRGDQEAAEVAARFDVLASLDFKPGEGPDPETLARGHFDILLVGEDRDGKRLAMSVKGKRDPGYTSTARMIAEAALCLSRDAPCIGGVWTPGALMGPALAARLEASDTMYFAEEPIGAAAG